MNELKDLKKQIENMNKEHHIKILEIIILKLNKFFIL